MAMSIQCDDFKTFMRVIDSLVASGLTFEGNAHSYVIKLLGGR